MATKVEVFPSREVHLGGFPATVNCHIENGRCMPAFDSGEMSGSAEVDHYFIRELIETNNPSGTPRQYAFGNNFGFYYEDGVRTLDQTFTAANVVQGAVLCNDALTSPNVTSNNSGKLLLVTFGTGANETYRYRNLGTDTSPWSAAVAPGTATAMTAFKIITVGADIIAATGGGWTTGVNVGRTVLGEYYICKCPNGSNPTLAASYGNRTAVGTAEWPIIDLVALGDSYYVAKGDGAWWFNDKTKRHENALAAFELTPHALNGKGMSPGENCVWYPTADGRLFQLFSDGSARDMTPYKRMDLPRDAAMSRYSVIVDRGNQIFAIRESWNQVVQSSVAAAQLGMKVIKVTGAGQTATDITTLVTDDKLSTPVSGAANMGAWGANATDKYYVGLNMPFEGVDNNVTRLPNSANNSFTSPQYSDGAAGWPTLGSVLDRTSLGGVPATPISLAITGFPAASSRSVLSWDGIRAFDLMQLESVAFGGSVGTVGPLYWARWSPRTTTGMTATTTIDEVSPVTGRPGYPNTGGNSPVATATQDFLPRINAQAGVSIIDVGYRIGSEIIWAPEFAVYTLGGVWAAAFTMARGGGMTNAGPSLLLWGRTKQMIVALGIVLDPYRVRVPRLVQPTTTEPAPTLAISKIVLGDSTRRTKLNAVWYEGENIQQADSITCYAWWDQEGPMFELDTVYGAPGKFTGIPDGFGTGRELNLRLIINDVSQANVIGPALTRVVVDYEDVGQPFDMPLDSNLTSPESI